MTSGIAIATASHKSHILLWVLGLWLLLVSATFAQNIRPATGGENISADDYASNTFTSLSSIEISETAPGQITTGNIRLQVPEGFRWDTGGADPSVTVSSQKSNTITVSFQSRSASEMVFQVSGSSDGSPPNNPHTITLSNLRVGPSRGAPLANGQIKNVGSSAPGGQTNYGSLSFLAGADAKIRVETAPDNSGSLVDAQDLEAGAYLTVYSNVRDQFDNFKRNESANWSLKDTTGGVTSGDFTPGNGSATLTANKTGSAVIAATFNSLAAENTGTITVTPSDGTSMVIATQPSNSATAGQNFSQQPVIEIHDNYGNVVTDNSFTEVTANRNSGIGSLQGTTKLTVSNGIASYSDLSHNIANDIDITFSADGLSGVTSAPVTINPDSANSLTFSVQPPNAAVNSNLTPAPEIQLVDQFGNEVPQSGTNVAIEKISGPGNLLGTTSETTNSNGIAIFDDIRFSQNGTYIIRATNSNLNPTSNSRDIIIAEAGKLANFVIETESGNTIGTQQAGTAFNIKITAVDGEGNVLDGTSGRDNFNDKVFIRSTGTLLAGSDSTGSFTDGVLNSHTVNISTADNTTISATDSSDIVTGTSNTFTVNPATANADSSFFVVDEDTLVADGSSQTIITVTLKDEYGNKLTKGGDNVVISKTGGGTLSSTTDNGDGTYQSTLTAPTNAGTASISVSVNGIDIRESGSKQEIDITYITGELSTFLIEDAGGNSGAVSDQTAGTSFNIKITAQDANGNTVNSFEGTGATVEITSSGILSSGGGTTPQFSNGVLSSHAIAITSSGPTTLEARKTASTESGSSNTFNVNPGPASTATTTISANQSFLEDNGTDTTSITVQLKDAFGNNLVSDDAVVTLSTTAGSLGSTVGTSSNGLFSTALTAGTSQTTATVTGSVGGQTIDDEATVVISEFNEWEGDAGGKPGNASDWTNTQNWSLGKVPTSGQVILIPNGLNAYPVIDNTDPVLDFLAIQAGAYLSITDRSMTVNTEISGEGSLSATNSTFTIKGNVDLANFIAGTSTVTLNGDNTQIIKGDFTAGVLNLQNNVTAHNYFEALTSITIDTSQTLTMEANSQLVSDGDITIYGALTGNSSNFTFGADIIGSNITVNDTDITLNGSSPQQIDGITEIKNFTLNNTAGVTVKNDLTVTDTLTITEGVLTITSGNSLVNNIKEGNTANIQIRRIIDGDAGWRMITPPLMSTYEDFLDSTVTQGYLNSQLGLVDANNDSLQPNVLYYDETVQGTDNQRWRAPDDATNTLKSGRGLFVYFYGDVIGDDRYNNPLPDTLTIQGAEHDGDGTSFTFPVTYTAQADTGWNLVGNPYAATIDWDDGNWTKDNMDNVIYVWDPSKNDYQEYNGIDGDPALDDGLIKPSQGFWVKANGNGTPLLKVNKQSKTTGGEFFEKESKKPASIEFVLETDSLDKSSHITLTPDGSNGKDPRDAFRLLPFDTDTYLDLYFTLDDGTELSINNLARSFGKEISIPLFVGGFKNGTPLNGEYTLSWAGFGDVPEEWTLTLEDKETSQKIDLRKNAFYTFNLNQPAQKQPQISTPLNFRLVNNPPKQKTTQNSQESRFVLRIKPGADGAGIPDEYSLGINYPNPFGESTTIKYNTPVEGEVQLLIFDILGRRVKTIIDERQPADFHEVEWNPSNLASGIYICVMRAGDKQFTKKLTYIK